MLDNSKSQGFIISEIPILDGKPNPTQTQLKPNPNPTQTQPKPNPNPSQPKPISDSEIFTWTISRFLV